MIDFVAPLNSRRSQHALAAVRLGADPVQLQRLAGRAARERDHRGPTRTTQEPTPIQSQYNRRVRETHFRPRLVAGNPVRDGEREVHALLPLLPRKREEDPRQRQRPGHGRGCGRGRQEGLTTRRRLARWRTLRSKVAAPSSNQAGRFARHEREPDRDALAAAAAAGDDDPPRLATTLHVDTARSIIARNRSPDIAVQPVDQPLSRLRARLHLLLRARHSLLSRSVAGAGLRDADLLQTERGELLRAELAAPATRVSPIALGTNTDPYQPVERELRVTRGILELLLELKHPLTIVTKGALILRDLDLLARARAPRARGRQRQRHDARRRPEAPHGAAHGGPRAAAPHDSRVDRCRRADGRAGRADHSGAERPRARAHARGGGRRTGPISAGYVLLRLPHEVEALFVEWLHAQYPDRAEHVLSLIRQMREGALNDPAFGSASAAAARSRSS